MAHAFFEKALEKGRRPLLVCFNRPLAERLKALIGQVGRASTFFGLCHAFLAERGRKLDFEQMKLDLLIRGNNPFNARFLEAGRYKLSGNP